MAEPLNPDPSIPRYLFIVVVLAGVAILFFIVVPILLHLPDRIGRWFWKEDDWVGISRRREFADGRHVSIFDVPTWARRLSLHRRPIDRRLAGKRKIDKIVLAGMSANLCVESHLRELLEQGFEVAVVKDATAAAKVPEGDGYQAAMVNFRFIANVVWTTEEATQAIEKSFAN